MNELERIPPQAIDCERSAIGAALLSDEAAGTLCDLLKPTHFYRPDHQAIVAAVTNLEAHGMPVDLVSVARELSGRLEEIGDQQNPGAAYLALLAEMAPLGAGPEYYCGEILTAWQRRELIRIGNELALTASNGEAPATLVEQAEARLYAVTAGQEVNEVTEIGAVIAEVMERLDRRVVTGIPTGLPRLDGLTGGILPGSYSILAARTSIGKTALAVGITRHLLIRGQPVLYVSYEDGAVGVTERLLAMETGVPLWAIRRSKDLTDAQLATLTVGGEVCKRWPLVLVNAARRRLGPVQIRRQVRRARGRHANLALVVIDYLQLVGEPPDMRRNANREQAVAQTSAMVASMAREFGVAVLALSQLNRMAEGRRGHQPLMSDLRESGSLEQDADVVMLLHRPGYYEDGKDHGAASQRSKLVVAKHRAGATGGIDLAFVKRLARFVTPGQEEEAEHREPALPLEDEPEPEPAPAAVAAEDGDDIPF